MRKALTLFFLLAAPAAFAQSLPLTISARIDNSPGPINHPFLADHLPVVLRVSITNPNDVPAEGVRLTVPLPQDVTYDSYPNHGGGINGTNCAGGHTYEEYDELYATWLNPTGPIAPHTTCEAEWSLAASWPGSYTITLPAGSVTSSNVPANTAPASASFRAVPDPFLVFERFDVPEVRIGSVARMTITIYNEMFLVEAKDVGFTDTYPAGLVNAPNPNATLECYDGTGTVTATAGSGSLTLSGARIRGGDTHSHGQCIVSVNVTPTTSGTKTNTIPAGAVTGSIRDKSGNPVTVPGRAASASLSVPQERAVGVAKSFSPSTINAAATSRLTITISDPDSISLDNFWFVDNFAPLQTAANPNPQTTCQLATLVTTASSVGIAQGSPSYLQGQSSCTVSISVTGSAGTYTNTIPAGAVKQGSIPINSNQASATLTITEAAPPSLGKTFTPSTVGAGSSSRLRLVLSNPNDTALQGAFVNDHYPSGLRNDGDPHVTNTCGGTVTASQGGTSLSLSGGVVPAMGSCVVAVDVVGSGPGTYPNTVSASDYGAAGAASPTMGASATLTVSERPPLGVRKDFDPQVVAPSRPSTMTITLTNNGSSSTSPLSFTDVYPDGMVNAPEPRAATTCTGTALATAGGGELQANNIVVPARASCTVTVDVMAPREGRYENTVAVDGSDATAVLRVVMGRRRPGR